MFAKLNDEVKAKEDLQGESILASCNSRLLEAIGDKGYGCYLHVCVYSLVSIKELEKERLSMQSDTEHYSDQVLGYFRHIFHCSIVLSNRCLMC